MTRLVEIYDQVFETLHREELRQEDLDRVQAFLDEADRLLLEIGQAPPPGTGAKDMVARAQQSQGRAMAALRGACRDAQEELGSVRNGRRALQNYGNRGEFRGLRISSQG